MEPTKAYLTTREASQPSSPVGLFPGSEELCTCGYLYSFFFFEARISITTIKTDTGIYRTLRIKRLKDSIYLQRRVKNICEYLCGNVVETVEIIFKMTQCLVLIKG